MNCKKGEMAVFIDCNEFPENNGLFVEILEPYFNWRNPSFAWLVKAKGRVITDLGVGNGKIFAALDCELRPIRGNQKQDTEIKELELIK